MAGESFVKRVLLLSTEDQEENCKKLRTVLEYKSGGRFVVQDLKDLSAKRRSLEQELHTGCDCIVLICCPRAAYLINNEETSVFTVRTGKGDLEVIFEGRVINKALSDDNNNLQRKVVPVSFVELPSVLHEERGREGRCSTIAFEIKEGSVNERMLQGDVLQSLIDVIKRM